MSEEIKIGNAVKDLVSGFQGIAVSRVEYLNGCIQFCVRTKSVDGKLSEAEYFDVGQLEYINEGFKRNTITSVPGGIMTNVPPIKSGH